MMIAAHMLAKPMALLITFLCVGSGLALADSEKVRVVTFGTSLSASGRWQRELQTELQRCLARDVVVVNKASNAKGSTWGVANVQTVIEAKPDIAIVEFAINDARLEGGSTLDTTRSQIVEIVETIKSARPSVKIFLMITNPVHGKPAAGRPRLGEYYQVYRDLAAAGLAGMVDTYQSWSGAPASEIPDGVHPTPAAHRAITVPAIIRALAPDCR